MNFSYCCCLAVLFFNLHPELMAEESKKEKETLIIMAPALFTVADDKSSETSEKDYKPSKKVNMEGFKEGVKKYLKEFRKKIKSDSISGVSLTTNFKIFTGWSKLPYIEEATKIRSSWFEDVAEVLEKMSRYKDYIYSCELRGSPDRADMVKPHYDKLKKKCLKILDSPVRIDEN